MQPNQSTTETEAGRTAALVGTGDLFEVFCDACYYGQWAVRPVGEKRWGYCYHLPSKEEAEGLAENLTRLHRALHNAERELVRLFTVLPTKGHLPSPSVMQECQWALTSNAADQRRSPE